VARNRILWRALARQGWLDGEWVEVGCGRGIVLQFLRQRGLEVRGVELAPVPPLPAVAPYLRTGVDVCDLPLAERSRPSGVLLLDVIEHLPDPVAFLRRLRESLPGARRWLVT
ncbi:MAG: class I SAM-dependent methyltransferase, partial [Planctomycetaceae bacterium]